MAENLKNFGRVLSSANGKFAWETKRTLKPKDLVDMLKFYGEPEHHAFTAVCGTTGATGFF
jgi:hypothetical protein